MVVQRFARKEGVIQGGEPATYFGVVLQGTLAIVLDRQPVLKVAGDILGEMAYFLGGVRGADIVAASEGFVATMTYRQLEAFKAHPSQGARALELRDRRGDHHRPPPSEREGGGTASKREIENRGPRIECSPGEEFRIRPTIVTHSFLGGGACSAPSTKGWLS